MQNVFSTVRKYAHCAISSVVAHRFRGVCSMISFQSCVSLMTQSLSGVMTPPGSRLLHVAPNCATRRATFFVYAITPPLLAQYSGNSDPVCPLADPMFKIERIPWRIPYFSVTLISALRFVSISPSFCVPALLTRMSMFSISGSSPLMSHCICSYEPSEIDGSILSKPTT